MSEERVVREFPVELAEGDGRTIDARIVPYNTPTRVRDGDGPEYLETWLPGAFEKQIRAADKVKVLLNFEHQPGLGGVIGKGSTLEDRGDALYGTFRVLPGPDGDKALELVHDGFLTGISLEAVARSSRRTVAGVVERVRAHLDKVSLCRFPAFETAEVLAVREQMIVGEKGPELFIPRPSVDESEPDEPEPPAPEPDSERGNEVDEVLRSLGFEPLVKRAVVRTPWNGAAGRFTDEQYARSALLCRPGDEPPKTRCSLPVLEPGGALNANALGAAAARINQVTGVSPQLKAQAARKLVRYYRQANMEPPEALRALAAR